MELDLLMKALDSINRLSKIQAVHEAALLALAGTIDPSAAQTTAASFRMKLAELMQQWSPDATGQEDHDTTATAARFLSVLGESNSLR